MGDRVIDAEVVEEAVAPLAKPNSGGITLIVGSPMDGTVFSQLESHLLSMSPGRFVVIDAPGNAMGARPYRIQSDNYSIGFKGSEDTNLIIPREDLLEALRNRQEDFARLQNYYESLRCSSGYSNLAESMGLRTSARLIFEKKDGVTRLHHTFPVNFPPISVDGAALQTYCRNPLGKVAAIRIGEDIKILYADNTLQGQ